MKLHEPNRTQEALRNAALAVSTAAGEGVFRELVRALAAILDVEIAFIALSKPPDRCMLGMLAYYADGRMIDDFEYPIAGTPCESVVGRQFRCYPSGLKERFPLDADFIGLGIEGYAGYPLTDARGEAVGLMVVATRHPITEPELIESVLKIFAARAVVELERQRAEAALRASEEQYRAIFNASFDSMIIRTLDGEIVDANPALLSMYGYAREELIGRTFGPIIPEKLAAPYRAYLAEVAAGKRVRTETRLPRKDGTPVHIEVLGSLVTYNGKPHVLSVARDITERRAREEALRASEEQYRAIFNATTDGLVLRDAELRLVDVNPALLAMTGFAREEVLGDGRVLFSPPEMHARVRDAYRRALAGERVVYESQAIRRDGSRFDVEMRYLPIQYQGMPHVLAVARDITERKRAETALRSSEEQYRAIFNASEDALVLWDSTLRRVDINPAYERLYGWSRQEAVGRGYETLDLPADYAEPRLELVRRTLAGETCRVELESLRKNGERFQADIRTIPVAHRGEPHVLAIVRDITERKRAEGALRASEEQYRAIFNATADALVLRDAQFRMVDVNAAYESMSGETREEVIGLTDLTLTRIAAAVDRRRLHAEALAGKPVSFEADGRRQDGSPFVLEVRGVPMTYRGEPHVLYAGRDITASKAAEGALRASEEQYRAIFNATADALVLRDAQFRIVDVNAAYESIGGSRREDVIGLTDLTLTRNAIAVDRRRLHAEALTGKPVSFEAEGRRQDGSPFVLEVRGVPMTYRGEPHVLYIGHDATEAKRAEQALRASEEQYRAVFVASLDALVLRDEAFRVVDVNPSYEKMSGYARAEVAGADHVVANPPEVDAAVKALHWRALAGEPVRMETQMIRRDGRPIDIELSGVRTMYQGRPHVLYAGRDITARKHAEARHRELEAQLRQAQKMEAIGQLTGGIAHDFNNILTGIMGYLTLAGEREAASSDAKLARHLQQAQHGATRAKELIQQMLAFSRAQRGKPRAVSLAPLAEEAVKLLGSSLPATVELRTALEQDLPPVMIDPVQVEQILLNLCINARDAMDGAGKITVGVRLAAQGAAPHCASCHKAADGRYVELAVSDTGPGIAPQVLERMFEPFYSTKEVGRGSGMGLATVHGIVHEHGGHVVVETSRGKGATFRVLLPALEGEAEAAAPQSPGTQQAKSLRHALEGRVLLVDDEQMVGEFMAELLGGWGLEVTVRRDPVEAGRWLVEDPARVDLVLTDQTMPKMTGLELARRVAALRPGLPVILYSGYSENIGAEQLARSGVRALLAKPVEPGLLFAALAEALRR